jgi:hypothetical protein
MMFNRKYIIEKNLEISYSKTRVNYIMGNIEVHKFFIESFTFILALLIESPEYTVKTFVNKQEGRQEGNQLWVRNCIKIP